MLSFARRVRQSKFSAWLREEIYVDGLVTSLRQDAILNTIRQLRRFIQQNGYVFRTDDTTMAKDWAKFLFLLTESPDRKKVYLDNPDSRREDHDYFLHVINYETWAPFEEWLQRNQDYQPDIRSGRYALHSMIPFAWYYIDINNSSNTQIVDEMVEPSDSEEEDQPVKKRVLVDPYLADQANSASKFNRWD